MERYKSFVTIAALLILIYYGVTYLTSMTFSAAGIIILVLITVFIVYFRDNRKRPK